MFSATVLSVYVVTPAATVYVVGLVKAMLVERWILNPSSFVERSVQDNEMACIDTLVTCRLFGGVGRRSVPKTARFDHVESAWIVSKPVAGAGYWYESPTTLIALTL